MRHATLSCVLLLLVLAGCAANDNAQAFRAGEPLGVAFSRSGGLAGGSHSLIITTDGDYTLERDGRRLRRGSLTTEQRADLRARIDRVRWDRLAETYPDDRGRDAYAYALSITSASGVTKGVTMTDASSDQAPEALRELARHLSGLIDELAPR